MRKETLIKTPSSFSLLRRGMLFYSVLLLTFTAARAAADALDISQYRGRVVVVDFWASWCVPCRRSFPWMNEMQGKYGAEDLVIIAVNMDTSWDDAQAFLDQYPAKFHVVHDPDGDVARAYDVIAMPSTYVFGRDGEMLATHLGFKVRQQAEYEAILVDALNATVE